MPLATNPTLYCSVGKTLEILVRHFQVFYAGESLNNMQLAFGYIFYRKWRIVNRRPSETFNS